MNTALVNGSNVFIPSYAPGVAGEWRAPRWSLTGVYMHVGREDADSFDFYGLELGFHPVTARGEGNYRLLVDSTGRDFDDATSTGKARRSAVLFSCDQQLGEVVGVFARLARQSRDAAIDYHSLYSGGVDLGGAAWGRPRDNVGVGYAYLTGGNRDAERTRVVEAYYRLVPDGDVAITADVQYVSDGGDRGRDPRGWVVGLRVTTEF